MKITLPSIIFALLGTTASAGLREQRKSRDVASESKEVQSLGIKSAGANGKQQRYIGPDTGSCSTGFFHVDLTITEDAYAHETTWEIITSQGEVRAFGESYYNYQTFNEQLCLPADSCYTFTLFDSDGDGLSIGNPEAGYDLDVDGINIGQGGPDNFGPEISHIFGFCGCPAGEVVVDLMITTDDDAHETTWEIISSQGEVGAFGGSYDDVQTYYEQLCLPAGPCYTFTLFDSYGDGLSIGNPDAGYDLDVDGVNIGEGGPDSFSYAISHKFGFCGCPTGEVEIDLTITTDGFGGDISWEITADYYGDDTTWVDDGNSQVSASGGSYDDFQEYYEQFCLPVGFCYTFSLFDSFGDGLSALDGSSLSADDSAPGFELVANGITIADVGPDNFGSEISYAFGGGSLKLEMLTDDWGSEIEMDLTDAHSWATIWENYEFANNTDYQYDACLDPNACTQLQILDSFGDGISEPGFVKITFMNEVYYDGGDYNSTLIYRFGNGC